MDNELRVIISGGGTGGHIFPAISIANAIRQKRPDAQILFVGAEGRMEMQRVPAAGYEIKGLPIQGFDRKNLLKNVKVLYKVWKSQRMAKQIIRQFRPMVAVGVGGYASGPTLNKCAAMGVPCLIQEQNSYAGVTNKLLAKKAQKICVAYEGMERFFPKEKIVMTGNPVRQALLDTKTSPEEARKAMGLDQNKKTILIVGGSLGARTMNESVLQHLDEIRQSGVQVVWQTGKYYHATILEEMKKHPDMPMLKVMDFIADMGVAYRAADLVISRAGASSISEFCLLGTPVILVPSLKSSSALALQICPSTLTCPLPLTESNGTITMPSLPINLSALVFWTFFLRSDSSLGLIQIMQRIKHTMDTSAITMI